MNSKIKTLLCRDEREPSFLQRFPSNVLIAISPLSTYINISQGRKNKKYFNLS